MLYREDIEDVRRRMTAWWAGEDIGRPACQVGAPRATPLEDIPAMPQPEGVVCPRYTARDLAFRVNFGRRSVAGVELFGEAVPTASPCLGPSCLALYLGCRGVEEPNTVWFEPCIESPETARFERNPDNTYWRFQLDLIRRLTAEGRGKFMVAFPDLIEGLDTLAAMRGTQELLLDLIERPEWVHDGLRRITEHYHYYYDAVYDLIRDETGGSHFWAWAPGKCVKLQCDFSAMIGPDMFAEFMVPVLRDLTSHIPTSLYHWDGPRAIPHHDHLLALPDLDMIQWTPGAGAASVWDPKWWPLYHKTIEAGKKVFLMGCPGIEALQALKREFGRGLKQFLVNARVQSAQEAQSFLEAAYVD